ncbi:hypothetical protein predicted by Glimmer/Critica [Sorangium cellulosum So ce56]|uniref:Uncharacterized protein n=1 Tax=Sorangium cellulosum (strain So ce56) TaxID=448385 RepID=A9FX55_SORC5|nr:hypothetical protein predicted by Glimmer/Critica [Sorangium cellulosum So ce56]
MGRERRAPSGSAGGLDELEGHAVALADRGVVRAVLVAEPEVRRQGPDPFRVVFRVLRIRVDLGLAAELEARRLDLLDHPRFREVSLLRALIGVGVGLRPVRHDTEDAARLERLERLGDVGVELAVPVPAVRLANGDDEVGLALDPELRAVAIDHDDIDLAEQLGRLLDHALHALAIERVARVRGAVRIERRDDELALLREHRREQLGVPALAGPELDDRARLLEAEELQVLDRVPGGVAVGVARGAVLPLERRPQRGARARVVGRDERLDLGLERVVEPRRLLVGLGLHGLHVLGELGELRLLLLGFRVRLGRRRRLGLRGRRGGRRRLRGGRRRGRRGALDGRRAPRAGGERASEDEQQGP